MRVSERSGASRTKSTSANSLRAGEVNADRPRFPEHRSAARDAPAYRPRRTIKPADVQAFPEILGVTFLFGTVPDPVPGAVDAVPEPHSLALLGIALVAGWVVRSRRSGKPALRIA